MKSTEFDQSKYLNAKSAGKLNGTTLTIYDVTAEMVGQEHPEKKMILSFEGQDKQMVVNNTNNAILTAAYGDETDNWRGKSVILHLNTTNYKGQATLSIQLEPAKEKQAPVTIEEAPPTTPAKKKAQK